MPIRIKTPKYSDIKLNLSTNKLSLTAAINEIKNIKTIENINNNSFQNNTTVTEELDLTIPPSVPETTEIKIPKEKLYSYDDSGNVSLKQVHPVLKDKIELLEQLCQQEGINIKITEDVRSVEQQNNLYSKGRTTSGNIVTNAKGEDYNSFHQWGVAFDICINEVGDAYNIEKLKRVGEIGKTIGLEWGGDWTDFVDMPHFQLAGYEEGIEVLKDQYTNPAEFADTWNFNK